MVDWGGAGVEVGPSGVITVAGVQVGDDGRLD